MSSVSGLAGRLPHVKPKLPALRFLNVLLAAALVGLGVAVWLTTRTTATSARGAVRTAAVSRGVVLSSVSATGTIEPTAQVGLDFTDAGTLTAVDVQPGQRVKRGQVLGRIDATDAKSSLAQAEASLAQAQANLQETTAGETTQQKAVDALGVQSAEMQVKSAKVGLAQARSQLRTDERATAQAIAQAGTSLSLTQAKQQLHVDLGNEQAAVARIKADRTKLVVDGTTYTDAALAVAAANNDVKAAQAKQQADQATQLQLQTKQTQDNQTMSNDKSALSDATAAGNKAYEKTLTSQVAQDQDVVNGDALALSNLAQTLQADGNAVTAAQTALSTITSAQQSLTTDTSSLTSLESKIVSDRNSIANTKSSLASAVSSARSTRTTTLAKDRQAIASAEQQVASAQLSARTTAANNAVKQAPPTGATVAQLRAAVLQAQASVITARKAVADTVLRAPEAGVIASVDGVAGGAVSAGGMTSTSAASAASSSSSSSGGSGGSSSSSFVTMLGSGMEVTAQFSESDASKVQVGQAATVTVSALPGRELAAHVVSVGVVGSSSSGVVEYPVVFAIDRSIAQLKSGMSANVSVTTAERDNVLNVPSAAVTGSGSNARVTVVTNGVQSTVPVVAGLKGDTTTEIVSGVKAGQQVVTSTGATLFSSGSSLTGGTSTTSTSSGGRGRFGGGGGGGFFGGGGFAGP